ncbi:MAG: DNA-binding response regulator [Melioribacteraceae bacterium]|nr:MAG: DNA-binding response regulator [Melioribacteraceae bacterium]
MKSKILLVDDEKDIVEFLQYNLIQEGFDVITAFDGVEALDKVKEKPDLIILDVMMPKMDGYEVCSRLRENKDHENIPVIFLTAKSSEVDEIKGLDLGADDFIQKPVSPKKIVARVKSNLRKAEAIAGETGNIVLKAGPLEIDREKYQILIDGEVTVFPKKEFEILSYLAAHPGKVFPREKILSDVWGSDVYVVERTIDVHVRKIREKLGDHSRIIETIKGVGYRFRTDE